MNKEYKIRNEKTGRLMIGVNAACTGLRAEGRAHGYEVLLQGINELSQSTKQYIPRKE